MHAPSRKTLWVLGAAAEREPKQQQKKITGSPSPGLSNLYKKIGLNLIKGFTHKENSVYSCIILLICRLPNPKLHT